MLSLKLLLGAMDWNATDIREDHIASLNRLSFLYFPFTREVNINADRKRLWLSRIESVEDKKSNDSMPISLNQFGKEEI